MRLLLIITCLALLTVSLPALAEVRVDKPSWSERKRHELRGEVRKLRVTNKRLLRMLRHKPSVREAIELAALTYGYRATLWRKADCETGHTFDPHTRNRTAVGSEHASGLLQFLPSTFRSTPYRSLSIWSPYANAMAAGWMHKVGRGGEWACR